LKGREGRETTQQFPTNEKIRALRVQLISEDGVNIGIVPRREALEKAILAGMDLVQISPENREGVPTVKIMDFGKMQYEKKKKQTEAKKHQKVIQVKEIKVRPSIAENDFQTKMKQMEQFLQEGMRVKLTLFFKGREIVNQAARGAEMFERVNQMLVTQGLASEVVREEDAKSERSWSYLYYLKGRKGS
jgi:translation initiation factor IF-3